MELEGQSRCRLDLFIVIHFVYSLYQGSTAIHIPNSSFPFFNVFRSLFLIESFMIFGMRFRNIKQTVSLQREYRDFTKMKVP